MNVRITKAAQGGKVKAIASKSEVHRLLICAALSNAETTVGCPECSEDIDATARCLEAMGASVKYDREKFVVLPLRRDANEMRNEVDQTVSKYGVRSGGNDNMLSLDCGESGSTLRFLLPICGALGNSVAFHMSGRLPQRPLSALYDEMAAHGCILSEQGTNPLICKGLLRSGKYNLPGNISSQFFSGLLLALALLAGDSRLHVIGNMDSRPYVDITLETMKLFGVTVSEEEGVFRIPGSQVFSSPSIVNAGGDWSNAAFWLALGAISQKGVTCTGLESGSHQGDKAIVKFLSSFGAKVTEKNDEVSVTRGQLRGIEIDAGNTPDLVPALAVVACAAEGKTTIRNAGRLRIKESDRLRTVAQSLSDLGADVTEREDGLVIVGKTKISGGVTQSFGDHRIAMASAIVSSICTGPVEIFYANAINKSYPGFFADFTALGGHFEIIQEEKQ